MDNSVSLMFDPSSMNQRPSSVVVAARLTPLLLRFIVMFPYSYSCEDFPKDAETLMEAGLGVAKAVKADAGTQYKAGQACDLV